MWCIVISNACSFSASRMSRPRMSGPAARSNAARRLRGAKLARTRPHDRDTPGYHPPLNENRRPHHLSVDTARSQWPRTSCVVLRDVIPAHPGPGPALHDASSPVKRKPDGMWYAWLRPSNCAKNHKRCCANDSANGSPRSIGVIAGNALRSAPRIKRAISVSTGRAKTCVNVSSTPNASRIRDIRRTASSECPPRSKKLS